MRSEKELKMAIVNTIFYYITHILTTFKALGKFRKTVCETFKTSSMCLLLLLLGLSLLASFVYFMHFIVSFLFLLNIITFFCNFFLQSLPFFFQVSSFSSLLFSPYLSLVSFSSPFFLSCMSADTSFLCSSFSCCPF